MSYPAVNVAEEAKQTYLNFGGVTNNGLLPIIQSEYLDLQRRLRNVGAPVMSEEWVVPVSANALLLSTAFLTNLVTPYEVLDKPSGASDLDYIKATERFPLPIISQIPEVRYWAWREERILINSPSSARSVLVRGTKSLDPITTLTIFQGGPTVGAMIDIDDTQTYLSAAVAAKAALTIGRNPTLAEQITAQYVIPYREEVLNQYARKEQTLPFRHRVWRRGR